MHKSLCIEEKHEIFDISFPFRSTQLTEQQEWEIAGYIKDIFSLNEDDIQKIIAALIYHINNNPIKTKAIGNHKKAIISCSTLPINNEYYLKFRLYRIFINEQPKGMIFKIYLRSYNVDQWINDVVKVCCQTEYAQKFWDMQGWNKVSHNLFGYRRFT